MNLTASCTRRAVLTTLPRMRPKRLLVTIAVGKSKAGGAGEGEELRVVERAPAVGDRVRLKTLGATGVVERVSDGEAEVRVGAVRLRERVANLEVVEGRTRKRDDTLAGRLQRMAAGAAEVRLRDAGGRADAELNLIGRTTDEAADAVDKFLDEVYLEGHTHVRVIHGHGTGALRRAVAELLKSHPHVASFGPAPANQGGAGATVVELKQ